MTTTTTAAPDRPPEHHDDDNDRDGRAALARLGLVVVGGLVAAYLSGAMATVLVVVAIIVMIMLHELGHFATAKWSGMKVTEYFLGFGPRLWSVRRGETEYGIKAIPAGGYVKIIGMSNLEEVDPADEPRTYRQQSYPKRMAVALAGSAMHFLIAFVLLYMIFAVVGLVDYDRPQTQVGSISRLRDGPSPAQQAGFRVGDRLVSVDGRPVGSWDQMTKYIRARPGQPIVFGINRDGRPLDLTATPIDLSKARVDGGVARPVREPTGFVGIGATFPVERAGPVEAVGEAATGFGRVTAATVKALATIFSPGGAADYGRLLLDEDAGRAPDPDEPRFLSPVGFVRVASQAADTGVREVLTLLMSINLFVGVFNLIPLLPLDGGHVAIATYERVRSRRGRRYHADIAKVMPIYYAVFAVLVFLGVSALYLDIVRPIANPFR